MDLDQLWPALLTGTVIGAAVTGLFTLLKPFVDYGVAKLTRRLDTADERRKVVEDVVFQLRKLRVAHHNDVRNVESFPYDLVLQASDSALLIHDQDFARYLSLDIENTAGFRTLADYNAQHGDYDGDPAFAARASRWQHIKTLVSRASRYAVTGKWEKDWMRQAQALQAEMDQADRVMFPE